MIRHHTVRGVLQPVRVCIGDICRGLDKRTHQINVVIVMFALQHSSDPFQPHPCINGRARKIKPFSLCLFILHEHQIPDLNKPVTIFIR